MNNSNDFLADRLSERVSQNLLRTLTDKNHLVDFSSNDYLGFAHSQKLKEIAASKMQSEPWLKNGSTGSRLISGNSTYTESLEQRIADFHHAPAGLLFNSGYDANVGLFSCIAQKGDTILTDELIHASIIDGVRLSYAHRDRFKHNDLNDLEEKLQEAEGNIFIGVESVYSMDGDIAPLREMVDLAAQYKAHLIVDEAHATGIFGKHGEGLVTAEGLSEKVFARIHTFGKAMGVHGAIVLGSPSLKSYLTNFARSFVYTTALPPHSLVMIESAYDLLKDSQQSIENLLKIIEHFKKRLAAIPFQCLQSNSPIQGIIIPSNAQAKRIATQLEEAGLYAKAILSPTIPKGTERLRICLHAFNTQEEIDTLIHHLALVPETSESF